MSFKAGIVQTRSARDMAQNLREVSAQIREAHASGARFVTTPEVTNIFEPDKERLKAVAMTEAEDISVRGFSALAKELGVHLHIGSLALRGLDGKLVNRTLLFGPDGKKIAHYDKIHLFDIDLPTGESHRESHTYTGGADAVVADLGYGKFGLSICYDIRFPHLFHELAKGGAQVMLTPAAFTVPTGQAHWHVMQRARAIETGSYVLSAAQGGVHESGRATYGHSMAVSPWGEVLAELQDDVGVMVVDVDPAQSDAARARIPTLQHRKPFTLKTV